jgi:hypothetical protein
MAVPDWRVDVCMNVSERKTRGEGSNGMRRPAIDGSDYEYKFKEIETKG